MKVPVLFACGHQAAVADDRAPSCPTCGCSDVDRVLVGAPRFVGHAHGPCATFKELPAKPVDLAKGRVVPATAHPGGPLPVFASERAAAAAKGDR